MAVSICGECGAVMWWDREGRRHDAWEATRATFGQAPVLSRLPAVGAPGPEVLVCRAPAGVRLAWMPERVWLESAPELYVARDGRRFLIASPSCDLSAVLEGVARPVRSARSPA